MDDLRIPPGSGAPRGLTVPAAELTEQFSHSSGPGGQGVNTADSRVQLSLDLAVTTALDDAQRARALARLASRLSGAGAGEGAGAVLTVDASEQRSQYRNRQAARQRLAELLRWAVMPSVPRRATRPTRASRQRRLAAKRLRSEVKQNRRRPTGE
jgi:ribosome-associated protein